MTKQEVITTLMECTERLGRVPSLPELTRMSPVNRRMVRKYFGSYARALSDCNLTRSGAGYKVEMADLFKDWAGIARQLNKLPSLNEYTAQSQYSPTPVYGAVWGMDAGAAEYEALYRATKRVAGAGEPTPARASG